MDIINYSTDRTMILISGYPPNAAGSKAAALQTVPIRLILLLD